MARVTNESFTIVLSISGWPYAFRWKVRYDGDSFVEDKPEEVKIAIVENHPPNKKVLRLGQPHLLDKNDPIQFLLLADPDSKIFDQSGNRVSINLNWIVGKKTQNFSVEKSTLISSHDETIGLKNIESGIWQFVPRVNNHVFSYEPDRSGRFSIQAKLSRNNEERNSDVFNVVVDNTPPKPEDNEVIVSQNFLDNGFTLSGKPLRIEVKAVDRESGVIKIEAGIDLNDDGKLDDGDILADPVSVDEPTANVSETRRTILIPTSDLTLEKESSHHVLVRVTNGIKLVSKPIKTKKKIKFKPPPSSVVAKVVGKPGRRELVWILKKTDGGETEVNKKTRVSQMTIQIPTPGKYTLILRDTKGKPRGKTAEFEVTAGEKKKALPPINFR